jgi:hypothetical protein
MFGDESPIMRTVEANGVVVLAALRTPPNNLILSQTAHLDTLDLLARTLAAENHALPGVLGPRPLAEHFGRQWANLRACDIKPVRDLRMYLLQNRWISP